MALILSAALVIPGGVQAAIHFAHRTATGADTSTVQLVKTKSRPVAVKCTVKKRPKRRKSHP